MLNINTLILKALEKGSLYGLEIINYISEKTNGELNIKQPSLYSALRRFENRGFVTSYWEDSEIGGRRHYYTITEDGLEYLKSLDVDEEIEQTFVQKQTSDDDIKDSTDQDDEEDDFFRKIEDLQEQEQARKRENNTKSGTIFDESNKEIEEKASPYITKMDEKQKSVDNDIDYKSILGELYSDEDENSDDKIVEDIIKDEKPESIQDIKTKEEQRSKHFEEIESILQGKKEVLRSNDVSDTTDHLSTLPKKHDRLVQEIEAHYKTRKDAMTPFSTTEHYGKIDKENLKRNSYKSSAINKMEPRNYININLVRFHRAIIMSIIMLLEIGVVSALLFLKFSDVADNIHYIILGSSLFVSIVYFAIMAIKYRSFPDKKLKNRPALLVFNILKRLLLIILLGAILVSVYLMCGITFEKMLTTKYVLYWILPTCFIANFFVGFIVNAILYAQQKYYR